MSNVLPFQPRGRRTNRDLHAPAFTPPGVVQPSDRPYSAAEVARLLSLSLNETYKLLRAGEIPAHRLGRTWIVPRADLHSWVNNLPTAEPDDIDPCDRAQLAREHQAERLINRGDKGNG